VLEKIFDLEGDLFVSDHAINEALNMSLCKE